MQTIGSDNVGSNANGNSQSDSLIAEKSKTNVIKKSCPVDRNMISKYEELSLMVKKEVEKEQQFGQQIENSKEIGENQTKVILPNMTWWCAIAGGPGSGKSTLAHRVSEICNERLGIPSIVVPMDGYLFSRCELSGALKLDSRGCIDFLRRRGAPHTINVEKLVEDLAVASGKQPRIQNDSVFGAIFETTDDNKKSPSPFVFPDYRRTAPSDPIPNKIQFDPSHHRVVFVEGEYLLLGKGGMVPGYVTETESKRWKPLIDIFDSTWFVTCQKKSDDTNTTGEAQDWWYDFDFEEQRRRRRLYHLEEDEDDEETINAMFPSFSAGSKISASPLSKDEVATKRINSNDVLNMLIAETSKDHASLVIHSI
eukprot:CAMPEP_0116144688 /NCGR_PEP_ID=MMETSP0329-20121206/16144_1 /TAXON_ID=697910 /ORGANISM="Pseudo-nitzschia arenysensis, Strain B593" /LENGTH=366 /DNA_ID=CAMNT_0003640145 /DNA_START=352 /DNA_END=1452 /DNA_ORIENTATION=-